MRHPTDEELKKMNTERIREVLGAIGQSIDQKNMELYKKLIPEKPEITGDPEKFYFDFIYPHENFISGMINAEISTNSDVEFILTRYQFIERHFLKFIVYYEGGGCSADKSRTIVKRILRWFLKGEKIEFDYNGEYTFHLPKKVFTNHEEIIEFYEALKSFYFGNCAVYIIAIKNMMDRMGEKQDDQQEKKEAEIPEFIDISSWIKDIIEGPAGFKTYEEREMVVWHVPRERAVAEWTLRCLANPKCPGSDKAVDIIIEQRVKQKNSL